MPLYLLWNKHPHVSKYHAFRHYRVTVIVVFIHALGLYGVSGQGRIDGDSNKLPVPVATQ